MKKKISISFILLLAGSMSFGQYDSSKGKQPNINLAEQYHRQSKTWMKKSAILAGSGIALIAIGGAIFPKDYDFIFSGNSSKTETQATISSVLMIAGTGLFISSIPCLITGFVKKHKANLLLRPEKLSISPALNTAEWQLKTGIAFNF